MEKLDFVNFQPARTYPCACGCSTPMQTLTSTDTDSTAQDTLADKIHVLKNVNPWPGKPYPLGANYDGNGINFALFSEGATGIDLCLFLAEQPGEEVIRISLTERTDQVWHTYLPGLEPGLLYGYRVYGPWNPMQGQLFNPNKVLIDPYTKAIHGTIEWAPEMFGYNIKDKDEQRYLHMNEDDSAPYANKGVVIANKAFDWERDLLPETPMHETIIYELHVKGMTALNELVPPEQRGTYAGLAHPKVIEYLLDLGVTAVELMPIHHFVHDEMLINRGLRNYWGYNTLGFFAPHSEYAASTEPGSQVDEFKAMVKAYHRAGLEVILDVVYNHTAEGNHFGPTLSFKGIDNQAYYRLVQDKPQFYMDYTGTGNTLNMVHPRVLQLVMDSLRYWVTEMHVDGFRFDLASALARGLYAVGKLSTFLDTIHQDPVISQVKLIAEPWDIGPGGYQVGNFPILWAEWNGKYRDCLRSFWKGDKGKVSELAYRLTGSSDLYEAGGRAPWSSINFITAHDGFTMRDLVSCNEKHNLANGENGNDGESNNESWNCGVEGPTDDEEILALRAKQQRNFFASLLLSQGVPMITMGDEYGRTQLGNNNCYCQDNELSYFRWNWTADQRKLVEFVRGLIRLRSDNPILHRRKFFSGRQVDHAQVSDIFWLRSDGKEMQNEDWSNSNAKCLGVIVNGEAMTERDMRGRQIRDDIFLLLFNAHHQAVAFTMPGDIDVTCWEKVVDTQTGELDNHDEICAGTTFQLAPRSTFAFVRTNADEDLSRKRPWHIQMGRQTAG